MVRRFLKIIRDIIRALGDYKRWAIIAKLMDGESTFNELKSVLELEDDELEYHLKKLTHGYLVERWSKQAGGFRKAVYRLSPIGKEVVKQLPNFMKTEYWEWRLTSLIFRWF